jgi:hypothetical protein
VYSIGSNNDFSFDDHMASLGCEVHTFDPTLKWPEIQTKRGNNTFKYGIGIAGRSSDGVTGMRMGSWQKQKWKVRSMKDIMRQLHHDSVDIVKMDVEGNEWPVLESIAELGDIGRVRQIVFEIHLWPMSRPRQHAAQSHAQTHKWYRLLLSLRKSFDLFFNHPNPQSSIEYMPGPLKCCYELSMVLTRRKS